MVALLLERMERWLATHRPEYFESLRPGVTPEALDAAQDAMGVLMPEALRQLYLWRDGQSGLDSIQHNLMFMPLASVVRVKAMHDSMIGRDFPTPRWWRDDWIPFLANGAGDHLCVDTEAIDGGIKGQLRSFYHDWDHRPTSEPSVEAWLKALVESMEDGTLELA